MNEPCKKECSQPIEMDPTACKALALAGLALNAILLPGLGTVIGSIAPENRGMLKRGIINMVVFVSYILILMYLLIPGICSFFLSPANVISNAETQGFLTVPLGLAGTFLVYFLACLVIIPIYIWGIYDSVVQIKNVFFKK